MNQAYTSSELMTINSARLLRDGDVVFVGVGIPNLACNLARRTHAPNLLMIYEAGVIGARPNRLPLSIGDPTLVSGAAGVCSMYDIFTLYLQRGNVDVGFLGGAQIDRFGNINATVIGEYTAPKVRLPGSGGSQEIAAWAKRCYVMTPHQKRRFPERVDFSTSSGFKNGRGGPQAVVTDLGILEPDESGELVLAALHPGATIEQAQANTGWVLRAAAVLRRTEPPSPSELRILREELDPEGIDFKMTDAVIEVIATIPLLDSLQGQLREFSQVHLTVLPARRPDEISNELWARCEVLYTDRILPAPNLVPNLKWLQFHFTGIDFAVDSPLLRKPGLVVTTLSGAAAPQMAEYILMMLLSLGHHLPEAIASQQRSEWPRDRWERLSPRELRGSTVGLVGYGSINREVARLLQFFNVTVLAVKRDAMHPEDHGYSIPGMGDPLGNCFDRLYPTQALKSMVKECDFVVVTLPLTPQTRDLIDAETLASMKPGAYLIQAGRGGVVDQGALVEALLDRRIAGAALDTFSEEPLPVSSPLWKMPGVLITPHIGSISPFYLDRAIDLFVANLQRYVDGEPLLNPFNPEQGY